MWSPVAGKGVRRSGSRDVWRIAGGSGWPGGRRGEGETGSLLREEGRTRGCGRTGGRGVTVTLEGCLGVGKECIETERFL